MLRIGITGGMGSGKTTVCHIFETLGVPVYYADDRGKYLLQHNEKVKKQVREAFGTGIYNEKEEFDRVAMAAMVFSDSAKLRTLESIVHPAVQQDFEEWANEQSAAYILKEAALLFESGSYKALDKIIMVYAPVDIRVQRVVRRDKSTPEKVMDRINKQWADEKKKELADYIIFNDDSQALLPQVMQLHETLTALAK
jgi:dephospho-CoA kinase